MQFNTFERITSADHTAGQPEPTALIEALFPPGCAVSVFGTEDVGSRACEELATTLTITGRRVVVVSVPGVLNTNPILHPDLTGFAQEVNRSFYTWPPPLAVEAVKRQPADSAEGWLPALCRYFDSVLLDCPELKVSPASAAIAAMAGSAVLAVEIGKTSSWQVLRHQRILHSTGIQLTGSILIGAQS